MSGIYIGKNNVIALYPAIEINGTNINSTWLTINSTKEKYDVEITIMIESSTQEDGYIFLLEIVKIIRKGLKQNLFLLVTDYVVTQLTGDVLPGDQVIRVADSSVFNTPLTNITGSYPQLSDARAILENKWRSEETRVQQIFDPNTILIEPNACNEYRVQDNGIVVVPKQFIYNSWPEDAQIGTTSREGTLLQTAVIRWFGDEEVPEHITNQDPHLY